MAVVDGIELDIMQEMVSNWNNNGGGRHVGMVFCWQGEAWSAITGKRVKDRDWWYQRPTQGSGEM